MLLPWILQRNRYEAIKRLDSFRIVFPLCKNNFVRKSIDKSFGILPKLCMMS